MDFFAAQDAAKKRTAWAIFLFILGTLAVSLAVYAAYTEAWYHYHLYGTGQSQYLMIDGATPWWKFSIAYFNLREFIICEVVTISIILLASLYKISALGAGGVAIAQSLGARFIDPMLDGEKEKRLQNIVEEMAIASGYAVPHVAVLDSEPGINAFAAAISQRDAVIVVTRGALEKLNRDELQAVVGHEFSHLLNGDSRLNINLAGWIFGLFFIFIIGRMFLNGARFSDDRDSRRRGGGLLFGFSLIIIGLIGYIFGRIIQALISRQREFLADASSVQFTRNPSALITALGKIEGDSRIEHHNASGLAHFFFANSGITFDIAGLFATHPPLNVRMKALDKNYEQILEESHPLPPEELHPATQVDTRNETSASANDLGHIIHPTNLVTLLATAGSISASALDNSLENIEALPSPLKDALCSPQGAQALLLGLALPSEDREGYLHLLQEQIPGEIYRILFETEAALANLDSKDRLPLAQLTLSRARKASSEDKYALIQALETIITHDNHLSTFEALYAEFIRAQLQLAQKPTLPPTEAASRLLSFLYASQNNQEPASADTLASILDGLVLPNGIRPIKYVSTISLRAALPALNGFGYLQRRELLIACGRVLKLDNVITDEEAETLRLIAALMNCPIPARI